MSITAALVGVILVLGAVWFGRRVRASRIRRRHERALDRNLADIRAMTIAGMRPGWMRLM